MATTLQTLVTQQQPQQQITIATVNQPEKQTVQHQTGSKASKG